jgi:prolyl-tRNA synthetase
VPDTIYLNKKTGIAYNKEVMPKGADTDPDYEVFSACEVGNIFPLGTKFSQAFNYRFTDKDGEQKLVWMGSYGIGPSRVMGVIVEKFHDDKGIIWPKNIAPFQVHLVELQQSEKGEEIYASLTNAGIEVLWDDREARAGEKFADADLIGCPVRVVVSQRSLDQGGVEVKLRNSTESKIIALDALEDYLVNV